MKVNFTIDIPEADFENLCKKMKLNKPHKIPNLLKGKKGVITDLTHYGPKFPGGPRDGEIKIVILEDVELTLK